MNISPEQQQDIKDVLWHNLKYRETFNELYDHILSLIEHSNDAEKQPHELAKYIIANEFGGWDGIKQLETQREKSIQSRFRKKLWNEMKSYLRFPLIAFTLLLSVSVYSATQSSPKYVMTGLFLMVMAPAIMWYMIAPFNRWGKMYKPSIKERSAERLGTLGLSFINLVLFLPGVITDKNTHEYWLYANTLFLTPVAVLLIVYGLSAVKIFRQDLQTLATS